MVFVRLVYSDAYVNYFYESLMGNDDFLKK